MTKIAELYGVPTHSSLSKTAWAEIVKSQQCPFLNRKCLKNRKSDAEQTIGSCTVTYGMNSRDVMICPFRLLERRQIFEDCKQLVTLHQSGNEWHILPELDLPGGSVDYCLVSVRKKKVIDFVGIELQTLDTTGTVWPERQRFLQSKRIEVNRSDIISPKKFGMNWKMTAKTILVQLHHKIDTFEHLSKKLVLVLQDDLLAYMKRAFKFGHLESARLGDSMHFHAYSLDRDEGRLSLELKEQLSTDSVGIASCLGLQSEAKIELEMIVKQLESKLSDRTLLSIETPLPPSHLITNAAEGKS
jgi:hypothetical protein